VGLVLKNRMLIEQRDATDRDRAMESAAVQGRAGFADPR
jgi:hypothetical protein